MEPDQNDPLNHAHNAHLIPSYMPQTDPYNLTRTPDLVSPYLPLNDRLSHAHSERSYIAPSDRAGYGLGDRSYLPQSDRLSHGQSDRLYIPQHDRVNHGHSDRSYAPQSDSHRQSDRSYAPQSDSHRQSDRSYAPQSDSHRQSDRSYAPQSDNHRQIDRSYAPQSDSHGRSDRSYAPQSDSQSDRSYAPQSDSQRDRSYAPQSDRFSPIQRETSYEGPSDKSEGVTERPHLPPNDIATHIDTDRSTHMSPNDRVGHGESEKPYMPQNERDEVVKDDTSPMPQTDRPDHAQNDTAYVEEKKPSDQSDTEVPLETQTSQSMQSKSEDLSSSSIPELPHEGDLYPPSSLPLLRTTFESAKFWLHCAENACQRTAQFDPNIGQSFQRSVQAALRQFIASMKDASQKCIDEATRYLPDLSVNPESLMPPVEQSALDQMNESFDVKPDRKTLERAMQTRKKSAEERQNGDTEDIPYGANYDMDVEYDNNDDDDDDDDDYLINKNMKRKSRRLRKFHDNTPSFKCKECDIDFMDKEAMLSHIDQEHAEKESRVCPICSKSYSTPKAMKKHINEVHNKRKECHICGKKFAYKYELDRHVSKHTGESPKKEPGAERTFSCQVCGYQAKKISHVKSHIRAKHSDWLQDGLEIGEFIDEVGEGEENGQASTGDDIGDFSCMICNRSFKTKKLLHTHLKTHLGDATGTSEEDGSKGSFECKKCHKKCASRKALFVHIKRVHSKSMKCKFCHKTFFARYQLEGHLRVHMNLRPFRCDVCSKAFSSLTALRIHTRLKHPERMAASPYRCTKCDIAFTFKAQLEKHNQSHSSSDPAFKTSKPDDLETTSDVLTVADAIVKLEKMVTDDVTEQCKKCGRCFSSDRLLWQHIRRVHNKKFACKTCGKKFGYPGELKEHEMFHTNKNAFACDFCDKTSHTRALIVQHAKFNHPNEVRESQFPCDICQMTFPLSVSLNHHMQSHAPMSIEQFPCDICLINFPTQLRLKTHKMVAHDADKDIDFKDTARVASRRAFADFSVGTPDPVTCTKCGLEFPTMDALSKHKISAHKNDPSLQCPACDKICANKEALRDHKRRVHGKKRVCAVCNKKFPFQYALDAHMLTHTGERNFTCQSCKRQFYTIQQLNVHIRYAHSNRSFACDRCGTKFSTKQGRDRHVQHRHTMERPHTCEFCGRGFVDRRSLKAHIFTHTRQSDIKCELCGKLFGTRSCLNKHVRINHHGERKLCPICGKHIAGSIGPHLKSHGEKRYKCHLCEKIYAWPQGLKEHLRTHSGDKPYECKVCSKRFLGSANFSKHKKVHSKDEVPRRKVQHHDKEESKPQHAEDTKREPDFHSQYQAVMNQSINQLMMNPGMLNPSMMNQSMLNQQVLNQQMMMHNEINQSDMPWQF